MCWLKLLSISDLQIDYLDLENLLIDTERETFSQPRCSPCGGSQTTRKYFKKK